MQQPPKAIWMIILSPHLCGDDMIMFKLWWSYGDDMIMMTWWWWSLSKGNADGPITRFLLSLLSTNPWHLLFNSRSSALQHRHHHHHRHRHHHHHHNQCHHCHHHCQYRWTLVQNTKKLYIRWCYNMRASTRHVWMKFSAKRTGWSLFVVRIHAAAQCGEEEVFRRA